MAIEGRWYRIDLFYLNIITVFMYGFQNAHYEYDFEIIHVCILLSRSLLKVAKSLQTLWLFYLSVMNDISKSNHRIVYL